MKLVRSWTMIICSLSSLFEIFLLTSISPCEKGLSHSSVKKRNFSARQRVYTMLKKPDNFTHDRGPAFFISTLLSNERKHCRKVGKEIKPAFLQIMRLSLASPVAQGNRWCYNSNMSSTIWFLVKDETNSTLTREIWLEDLSLEVYELLQYSDFAKGLFLVASSIVFVLEVLSKIVIFDYLRSVRIKDRPINFLFLVDQVKKCVFDSNGSDWTQMTFCPICI